MAISYSTIALGATAVAHGKPTVPETLARHFVKPTVTPLS